MAGLKKKLKNVAQLKELQADGMDLDSNQRQQLGAEAQLRRELTALEKGEEECFDCSGEGVIGRGKRRKKCPACGGKGVIQLKQPATDDGQAAAEDGAEEGAEQGGERARLTKKQFKKYKEQQEAKRRQEQEEQAKQAREADEMPPPGLTGKQKKAWLKKQEKQARRAARRTE